jgi:hypothetical protein
MRKELYSCDVCGADKKDSNGWYRIVRSVSPGGLPRYSLWHWDDPGKPEPGRPVSHVCGLPDAMQQIARLEERPERA